MSINKTENIKNVQFVRDTKVDYKNGDPLINCIFKQFDKDLSGDFNDEEYDLYQKHLNKMSNRRLEIENIKSKSSVVDYYDKQILNLSKKSDKLEREFETVIAGKEFEKLLEFEKAHKKVERCGYVNDNDLPENALKYDISSFEMGIFDSETQSFTGENYKKGYIKGLETLSEEEKSQYLKLLDDAKKQMEKINTLREKSSRLEQQYDKAFALKDMAQNGVIDKVGSEEYENQAYQTYVNIRQQSNPFFKEIQEIEAKRNAAFRKSDRTLEDEKLIEQYNIQLQKLYKASSEWSISDLEENPKIEFEKGFNLTNLSERVMYNSADKSVTDTHAVGIDWHDENKNFGLDFTKEEIYSDKKTQHTYNANISSGFSRNNSSLRTNSNLWANNDGMINFTQDVEYNYKKFNFSASENVSSTKMPDETGNITRSTTTQTSLSAGHNIGHFNNRVSVNFAGEGFNTYGLSTSADYNLQAAKNLNINLNPSLANTYNSKIESFGINPSFGISANYSGDKVSANLRVSEDFSTTLQKDSKPQINNNISVNGGVSYKGIDANLRYNNNKSPWSTSNTYGASVSYNNQKAGNFSVEYNHSTGSVNTVSVGYRVPLNAINRRHKK